MILLKQHGPHLQPLVARGLYCGVTARRAAGGSWGDVGTEPSLGSCHQWELAVTQGTIWCPKQRAALRAELFD